MLLKIHSVHPFTHSWGLSVSARVCLCEQLTADSAKVSQGTHFWVGEVSDKSAHDRTLYIWMLIIRKSIEEEFVGSSVLCFEQNTDKYLKTKLTYAWNSLARLQCDEIDPSMICNAWHMLLFKTLPTHYTKKHESTFSLSHFLAAPWGTANLRLFWFLWCSVYSVKKRSYSLIYGVTRFSKTYCCWIATTTEFWPRDQSRTWLYVPAACVAWVLTNEHKFKMLIADMIKRTYTFTQIKTMYLVKHPTMKKVFTCCHAITTIHIIYHKYPQQSMIILVRLW